MATSNTARDFPLAPLQSMVWPLAILLMLVLPVAIVIAAAFGSGQPMPGSAVGALSVVLLLMLAALALLKRRRITLEDGVLVVAATFYTRTKIRKLAEPTVDPTVITDTATAVLGLFELDRPVRLLGVRLELATPD